jgi:hypothetical protein
MGIVRSSHPVQRDDHGHAHRQYRVHARARVVLWPFGRDGAIVGVFPERSREPPMMSNTAAQLAILADALTEIVDLASGGPKLVAPPVELLARAGDLAAEALAVAATHGPLPPCMIAVQTRHDGGDAEAAALFGSRSAFDFLWTSISGAHLRLLT